MSVNRTFSAVPKDSREWMRFLQGLFFVREFTMPLLGCATTPALTARYTVSAGIVCLKIPQMTAESNSTLTFLGGLPGEITPAHDQQCLAPIVDNGVTAVGIVHIGVDTGITLFKTLDGLSGAVFTNSGTKGIKSCAITYPLD